MSARELVSSTSAYLRRHGVPQARLDAELLLAHVLDVERIGLYLGSAGTPSATQCDRHWDLVRQRAHQRVPLAYLTGVREFWSQPFWVTRDVLIPRPETETLVEAALAVRPERVLEIGVGSGAVTGALALELPRTRFVAVDRSRQALAVARVNLERLGVATRVSLLRGDGSSGLRGPFDLIVSNPPYIPSGELGRLPPEVQNEPTLALDGGPDGLRFVRRLLADAPALLARFGCLALEVGCDQAGAVREELIRVGAPAIETTRDLAGVERVVLARFRED